MEFRTPKEKLAALTNLMNEQTVTPVFASDKMLYAIDAAITPEEVDFMLDMGGGRLSKEEIKAKVKLPEEKISEIFAALLEKGHITELDPEHENDDKIFHIMSIFPGWFELFLMRGAETPERKLFSERMEDVFKSAIEMGGADFLNQVLREVGPTRSIAVTNPEESTVINIGQNVRPPVNEIVPPNSVLSVIDQLDESSSFAVGHCFCRQQKKLVGESCRLGMPKESCVGLGPAAEHLIKYNFARKITKQEAIDIVKTTAEKGGLHQVGRLVPLKNFNATIEFDIICNCCWDCCAVVGNYSRGNLPFIMKSYYIAEIPDSDICTGCGSCEEFCPVRAVTVNADGIAEINPDMCCGCGLCASHCPENVFSLVPSEREVFLPILEKSNCRV